MAGWSSAAKEGLNAHAVLIDELHAQRTRDLWDTLRYAGASRWQPMQLAITTAGYDRHSICWEQHDYMLKVLDGSIETDAADNWKPSKKKSVERIDGIVALIMGLDRASTQDVCTSVYEKHGLRSL